MAPTPPPRPVSVTGGTGGITAQCERIADMGRRFGAAASESLHASWSMHGYLFESGLLLSAALDPGGWAEFEAALFLALDAPQGLSWAAVEAGVLDVALRTAAGAYEAADQLDGALHDQLLGALELPAALLGGLGTLVNTGSPILAADYLVTHDPAVADTVIDMLGVPAALTVLGNAVPDGHGVVHDLGTDAQGVAGRPPRTLSDVVGDLARRNDDSHHGAIDVRILTMPDGSRRVIVDITGTKTWTLEPTSDITSMSTNGRALVGDRTAYEQGVLAAMRRAGVRSTDDVMLVGHSEGGMVAVNTARDADRSGEFNVTHVVTAGSPIGLTAGTVPSKVKVLSIENSTDVVPHLDGRANPDAPNITTATGTRGDGTIAGDHSLDRSYLPLTGDVQASHDKSIRDFVTSADGYLRASQVTTHTYQITRSY